tara:strand:+ start:30 stop:851 length:822 start_codon:yes stop_codon:yes gene_type:complete
MIKKQVRLIFKFLYLWSLKLLNILLQRFNISILPLIKISDKLNFEYSKKTRRFILRKNSKKFGKIIFDGSLEESELCKLGGKYKTNKSSLNLEGHRSGYTSFYNLFFFHLINKKCSVAEIGIENNASTKMWRKYFKKAKIDCFELDKKKIDLAKKNKLKNVSYHYIDVSSKNIINSEFKKRKKKFDLIIDDSTHLFDHQLNIILNVYKYLKPGGILIIEDIYKFKKQYDERNYYEKIKHIRKNFSYIVFVETPHVNNFSASWRNEKILLLIKK